MRRRFIGKGNRVKANLFIGGVGAYITTKEILADFLYDGNSVANKGINPSHIIYFKIDNNYNLSAFIDRNYWIADEFSKIYFEQINLITYFIATDKFKSFIQTGNVNQGFAQQQLLRNVVLPPSVTVLNKSCHDRNSCKYFYYPNVNTLYSNETFYNNSLVDRLYLPSCVVYGNNNTSNQNIFTNIKLDCTIYINPSMTTINGGGLESDLAYAQNSRSATIVSVTDFTPPSKVTDLSGSNITSTSVDLNFTNPSSTNALDFFEVWIDDGANNPVLLYDIFDEISASGDTLSGLSSGTTYKIKIVACDEFWNRSEFSNEITITTL